MVGFFLDETHEFTREKVLIIIDNYGLHDTLYAGPLEQV